MKRSHVYYVMFLSLFFCSLSQAYQFSITNGTAYTIRIKIRGALAAFQKDNMAGRQNNILEPGATEVYNITGWNVGVCLRNIFVEYKQPRKSSTGGDVFLAIHPVTGEPTDINPDIIHIKNKLYEEIGATTSALTSTVDTAVSDNTNRFSAPGDNSTAGQIAKTADVTLNIVENIAAPEVALVQGVADASNQLIGGLVKSAVDSYAGSLCRDRELQLFEVARTDKDGKIIMKTKNVFAKDDNGNQLKDEHGKLITKPIQFPATYFEFRTHD